MRIIKLGEKQNQCKNFSTAWSSWWSDTLLVLLDIIVDAIEQNQKPNYIFQTTEIAWIPNFEFISLSDFILCIRLSSKSKLLMVSGEKCYTQISISIHTSNPHIMQSTVHWNSEKINFHKQYPAKIKCIGKSVVKCTVSWNRRFYWRK